MKINVLIVVAVALVAGCAATQRQTIRLSAPGDYESGEWTYAYRLDHDRDGNTIGHWGNLRRKGKPVDDGSRTPIGRKLDTPWGTMYFFSYAQIPDGPHGWLPFELAEKYVSQGTRVNPDTMENRGDFQQSAR